MAIACTAVLAQIRGALPEDEGAELSVPVRFWWWQPNVAQENGAHDAGPSMGRPHGQLLPTHP